jgi:hypothetical protein
MDDGGMFLDQMIAAFAEDERVKMRATPSTVRHLAAGWLACCGSPQHLARLVGEALLPDVRNPLGVLIDKLQRFGIAVEAAKAQAAAPPPPRRGMLDELYSVDPILEPAGNA